MTHNTPKQLMTYFSVENHPVEATEFRQFWTSLTDDEKLYYRGVDLTTGLYTPATTEL